MHKDTTQKHYLWYLAGAREHRRWGVYRGSGFEVGHGAKGIGFMGGGAWFFRDNAEDTGDGRKFRYGLGYDNR